MTLSELLLLIIYSSRRIREIATKQMAHPAMTIAATAVSSSPSMKIVVSLPDWGDFSLTDSS